MTEADILAATYGDAVTVYRPFKGILENGETVFRKGKQGQLVYERIPCALSSHTGGQTVQSPSTASAEAEYSLFTRPETDIEPNDFLVVERLGKTFFFTAGTAELQPSHRKVPVRPEKEIL